MDPQTQWLKKFPNLIKINIFIISVHGNFLNEEDFTLTIDKTLKQ